MYTKNPFFISSFLCLVKINFAPFLCLKNIVLRIQRILQFTILFASYFCQIYAEKVRPFVCDTVSFMHDALEKKKRILIEGANAMMLDIDFGEFKLKSELI